jgi:hypothetical protein
MRGLGRGVGGRRSEMMDGWMDGWIEIEARLVGAVVW